VSSCHTASATMLSGFVIFMYPESVANLHF
jgi:hypothetical protein